MVKPALRTKSIGFKVSEEEYAQLERAAQTSGRTLGEWLTTRGELCRANESGRLPGKARLPLTLYRSLSI